MASPKKLKGSNITNLVRQKTLLVVVFITGACSLILEILATRILSPYFGNTLFNVSSVIGVTLGALSFGYYFGGRYADRNPNSKHFYILILLSGVATLLTQLLVNLALPYLGYLLPMTSGPLIASVLLFSVPLFLLGMLSPFAIKLQELNNPKFGVGKLSGEVFFVSTLGSILGTLVSGFYLVPLFGIRSILLAVSLVLFTVGLLGSFLGGKNTPSNVGGILGSDQKDGRSKKKVSLLIVLVIYALFSSIIQSFKLVQKNTMYETDGLYEHIKVLEGDYKGKKSRLLLQDMSHSSAAFLEGDELAFDYTKYLDLYKLFISTPENALFLGGGAYSMPSYLLKNDKNVKVDVVEIEPALYDIAINYFFVTKDNRLTNHIQDARRFLHDSDSHYDIIFSDVYASIYSTPAHLTTEEFFSLARSKLAPGGVFLANIIGDLSRQPQSLTFSEIATFKKVFPVSYFFAVESPAKIETQNMIFLGLNSDKTVGITEMLKNSKDKSLNEFSDNLVNLNRFNLLNYDVLRDDFAPVENLSAALLKRGLADPNEFQGEETLGLVKSIVGLGSRHVGSNGHDQLKSLISEEVKELSDKVLVDEWQETVGGQEYQMANIFSYFAQNKTDRILLATHYDSLVDNPGANNSASGVAILLEVMRVLKGAPTKPNVGVDFAFFDGEEGLPGENWKPYGSERFAANIPKWYPKQRPKNALVLDMVCDKNLNIYYEKNSYELAKSETENFFNIAKELYPSNFISEVRHAIDDDHTPLNKIGIPSTLIIDFDYPYYNTQKDMVDKCSAESMEKVGKSILKYIYSL